MTEDLNHNVRGIEHFGAIGRDLRAVCGIVSIRIAGRGSSSRLHHHLQTRLGQIWNGCGHQRDAALSGKALSGHTYNHEASSDENQNGCRELHSVTTINSINFKKRSTLHKVKRSKSYTHGSWLR